MKTILIRKRHGASLIILVLFAAGLYVNTLANDFMWDDTNVILHNRYIKSLGNIPLFFTPHYWNKLHPYSGQGQYRPLRTITFALDHAFWKMNPAGYHVTNLLLHLTTVALVYLFVRLLIKSAENAITGDSRRNGFPLLPLLAALIFAAHPVHVESVAYIKNRSELMAAMFYLASLMLFMSGPRLKGAGMRVLSYSGSLICFVAALISKETALTLPVMLVAGLFCFEQKEQLKSGLVRTAPFWGLVALSFVFQRLCLETVAASGGGHIIARQHLLIIIKTLGWYMKMLVWPVRLNAEPVLTIPASILEPAVVLSLMALIALVLIALGVYNRSKIIFFALCWIGLTLVPAANIIYLESRPLAEQRLYLPSLGFCLLAALGIGKIRDLTSARLDQRKAVALALVITSLLLGFYSVLTVRRNADWKDPVAFYSKAVADSPDSSRAHLNLGVALAERNRLKEAVDHYLAALRIKPDYAMAYYTIGNALMKRNQLREAVVYYAKALEIDPVYAHAYNNMGVALMKQGEVEQAVQYYSKAITLAPDYADAHNNLGSALANKGKFEEAARHFAEALSLNPEFREAADNLNRCLDLMRADSP